MESNNNHDENTQEEINSEDLFKDEKGDDGSRNLSSIVLYSYPTTFLLEPTKSIQSESRLLIDKKTGRMKEIGINDNIPTNYNWKTTYSAFLGILHIGERVFMLVADKVRLVCKIQNNDIFVISSVTFIPFEEYNYTTQDGKAALKHVYSLRKLLRKGHYFSHTYDLTLSKQKASEKQPTEPRFQWNRFILKDVIKAQISKKWQIPLIQGYIGYFETKIMDKAFSYCLISRRSCYKAGTRFTVRGLDDDGNVANFVETEQIICVNGWCFSNLQLRGSAPVFWQQRGVTAQIKITRNFDFTNTAFLKHIEDLNNNWGRIICLNLMSKTKKDEQTITVAFEDHMKKNSLQHVRYEFFDFHHEVKGQKFDRVNPKIEDLKAVIKSFGFYSENLSNGEIKTTQSGVIRTNCLDCLDRTNFFQSKIAVSSFNAIMEQLKINLNNVFGQDPLYEIDNNNPNFQHSFIVSFKNLWALNADAISMHYAGTGSVISGVTKTGKRTFMGLIDHGMKTINRFYVGNFEDQFKQNCIDLLLGQHTETINGFGEIEDERTILEKEKEFAEFEDLRIFAITWNLAGNQLNVGLNLSLMFNFQDNPVPDLVVINLQEYIELNAANVVVGANQSDSRISVWREIIHSNLKKIGDFIFVRHQQLVGILILIFAKTSIKHKISHVETDIVKTGLGGNFGNKGAAIVKLFINDTSFCFINCHLESGNKSNNARIQNIVDIHQKAFQQEGVGKKREERIIDMDYRFLMGDMNWRLDYGNFETRELLSECTKLAQEKRIEDVIKLLDKLLEHDQFNLAKGMNKLVNDYKEGKIRFFPTYKYDQNSKIYDTSKKQRTPSWTDRIMWSCGELKIKQIFYSRREYYESDHRPVVAYFLVETKKIDKIKKEKIMTQIYKSGGYNVTRVTQEQEVIEDENYDGSNPYDTDQYFENELDSNPQKNWVTQNDSLQQAQNQIQNNLSEINLLDFDQPLTTNNVINNGFESSYNKQSQNNSNNATEIANNPFNNLPSDQIDLL